MEAGMFVSNLISCQELGPQLLLCERILVLECFRLVFAGLILVLSVWAGFVYIVFGLSKSLRIGFAGTEDQVQDSFGHAVNAVHGRQGMSLDGGSINSKGNGEIVIDTGSPLWDSAILLPVQEQNLRMGSHAELNEVTLTCMPAP